MTKLRAIVLKNNKLIDVHIDYPESGENIFYGVFVVLEAQD